MLHKRHYIEAQEKNKTLENTIVPNSLQQNKSY